MEKPRSGDARVITMLLMNIYLILNTGPRFINQAEYE